MQLVQTIPMPTAQTPAPVQTSNDAPKSIETAPVKFEEVKDTVEISKPESNVETKIEPPKISRIRLMFSRLTDEQIKAVNESKMLPENAKFVFGGKTICNNFFNFSAGARKLLPGYELKKNILGFTVVVPEGTKGFFIKKTPEEKAAKALEKAEATAVKQEVDKAIKNEEAK